MKIPEELLAKIEKDFDAAGMSPMYYSAYVLGYMACLKRFGGNNERIHTRPLGSNRTR